MEGFELLPHLSQLARSTNSIAQNILQFACNSGQHQAQVLQPNAYFRIFLLLQLSLAAYQVKS
jgi:hypothetical protein